MNSMARTPYLINDARREVLGSLLPHPPGWRPTTRGFSRSGADAISSPRPVERSRAAIIRPDVRCSSCLTKGKTYRINPSTSPRSGRTRIIPDQVARCIEPHPENFFARSSGGLFPAGSHRFPGIGLSLDKMLWAEAFAYNDAQRNRIGATSSISGQPAEVPVTTT